MAGTVSQYQQGAFATPVNGTLGDATAVLSNDNATRGKHNSHDADATIHVQSSTLASRPGASVAQRLWVTTDGLRAYLDTGSAWNELAYLPLATGGTVSGTVSATAFVGPLTGNVTGNASGSSGSCTGNAATATTLATPRAINGVSFDGSVAITVTAAAGTLTGATLAANVLASSLTSVGTLGSLTVSGATSLQAVTAGALLTVSYAAASHVPMIQVTNSDTGTGAEAKAQFYNGTSSNFNEVGVTGSSFVQSGIFVANMGFVHSSASGGLGVGATAGPVVFCANGLAETGRMTDTLLSFVIPFSVKQSGQTNPVLVGKMQAGYGMVSFNNILRSDTGLGLVAGDTADNNLYATLPSTGKFIVQVAGTPVAGFTAAGGLSVGNSAAATTPGSVVKKMQVFDPAGGSLGYVAIYSTIT